MNEQDLDRALAAREADLEPLAHDNALMELALVLTGEADAETEARVNAHAVDCATCRAELARGNPAGWTPRAWATVATVASVAAVVIAVLAWPAQIPLPSAPPGPLLEKGTESQAGDVIDLVSKSADGTTRRLLPGDRLVAGDTIAIYATLTRQAHLLVLHMDERREITQLAPRPGDSTSVSPGARRLVPGGGRLVPAPPGCEWFVGVFSDSALPAAEVQRQLATARLERTDCVLTATIAGARTISVFPVRR